MINAVLVTLFCRDLAKLKVELESYKSETQIWKVVGGIANSAGNLCLHLVGNLDTYIGATLGNTGYVRDRDAEFALKDIPRSELIKRIDSTIQTIQTVVPAIPEEQLKSEYPLLVLKEKTTTEYFLIHLAMHLSYHLGQINYHRRLTA
ncbi:MAG: DUF1572 family protein [Cyclobacteriaceae bacterium]|jgi:uncharacterized damage-inducible protein DinB|nr:DUF1572 family protein [Cyclobacteriaceae bacterium]